MIIAVDSSDEMLDHLRLRITPGTDVVPMHVTDNAVPLADGAADRVLAVNLLHEVRGERALSEMHRLLKHDGLALVVDWERGRPREVGPPDELLYDIDDAKSELAAAGFTVTRASLELPYHFALRATPTRIS